MRTLARDLFEKVAHRFQSPVRCSLEERFGLGAMELEVVYQAVEEAVFRDHPAALAALPHGRCGPQTTEREDILEVSEPLADEPLGDRKTEGLGGYLGGFFGGREAMVAVDRRKNDRDGVGAVLRFGPREFLVAVLTKEERNGGELVAAGPFFVTFFPWQYGQARCSSMRSVLPINFQPYDCQ